MTQDVFKKMMENMLTPEIQGCLSAVESIAGFTLPALERQPFLYFHSYMTNPEPPFLRAWRSEPSLEKWYHRLVDGVLGDVQNGFACVLYHFGRLKTIESNVVEAIERFDYRRVLGNSTLALGNTRLWDFEFQAFVLAFRRCLDYLARAIAAYFRNEFHSFRRLGNFLGTAKSECVGAALLPLHQKYLTHFQFVLSDGDRRSLRDKISHYQFVPAGTVNLSQRGFVFVRTDESTGGCSTVVLSEVLEQQVANLRACIREMVPAFVDAIRREQVNT
jgi:hypothetical protein